MLDIICDPYVGEEQVAEFETVFTAVRYISSTVHLKSSSFDISVQQLINIEHFQNKIKKYEIIIICCIHIHTRKHQIDAEEENIKKYDENSYINI